MERLRSQLGMGLALALRPVGKQAELAIYIVDSKLGKALQVDRETSSYSSLRSIQRNSESNNTRIQRHSK